MKKFLFLILGFLSVLVISGCNQNLTESKESDQEPVRVVENYFKAWNSADYITMYNLISDGFKKIEPTAVSLNSFRDYAVAQGITKVVINKVTLKSNNGDKATVDYDVVFITNRKEIPFKGTFTLRYKPNDSQPGWKLIHPYGENIDTT